MNSSVRSYIAEFVGTFTLVFIGTSVATLQGVLSMPAGAGWLGISLAFGFTLMVLVLVIGPVSGCHINPAVTIPMAISGRLKPQLAVGYIVAQLLGALAASAVLAALLSGLPIYESAKHGLGANGNPHGMAKVALFWWELIITALFLFTIFSATREGTPPAATALAIGGFLFVAHLIGAPLGDSSLNPARSFGPALLQGGDALGLLWIFIVGPILGGLLGYILYVLVYGEKFKQGAA